MKWRKLIISPVAPLVPQVRKWRDQAEHQQSSQLSTGVEGYFYIKLPLFSPLSSLTKEGILRHFSYFVSLPELLQTTDYK